MARIQVALFGLGKIGRIHLDNLLVDRRVEVAVIVEFDVEGARKYLAGMVDVHIPVVSLAEVQEQVWKNDKIAAVLVCVPTNQHSDIVKTAITNGKAVFCEKPVSPDLQVVEDCYSQAKQNNVLLFCALNRRFDPSFQDLKKKVLSKSVGQILTIRASTVEGGYNLDYLATSGGIFQDSAIHDLDLVCWVLGEFPKKVYVTASCYDQCIAKLGDHDTVVINMEFPSGCIGTVELSRQFKHGYVQEFQVFGSEGLLASRGTPLVNVHQFSSIGCVQPVWTSPFTRYDTSYKVMMSGFIDLLQGAVCLDCVQPDQYLQLARLTTACRQSVQSGLPVNITD